MRRLNNLNSKTLIVAEMKHTFIFNTKYVVLIEIRIDCFGHFKVYQPATDFTLVSSQNCSEDEIVKLLLIFPCLHYVFFSLYFGSNFTKSWPMDIFHSLPLLCGRKLYAGHNGRRQEITPQNTR